MLADTLNQEQWETKKVLVADDSPTIRRYVIRILQQLAPDATYEEATDGEEAIAAVTSQTFDLIVLDVMMPKVDGLEFLKKTLDRQVQEQTGVLVLSSVVHSAEIEAFEIHPNVRFVRKPADPAEILFTASPYIRAGVAK